MGNRERRLAETATGVVVLAVAISAGVMIGSDAPGRWWASVIILALAAWCMRQRDTVIRECRLTQREAEAPAELAKVLSLARIEVQYCGHVESFVVATWSLGKDGSLRLKTAQGSNHDWLRDTVFPAGKWEWVVPREVSDDGGRMWRPCEQTAPQFAIGKGSPLADWKLGEFLPGDGWWPTHNLDVTKPPRGGSGVPPKEA